MTKLIAAALALSLSLTPGDGQPIPPNLPTEPANPREKDVWIWVETPVGALPAVPTVIKFWAFRCGGRIEKVRPTIFVGWRDLPLDYTSTTVGNKPRPDVVAAMQSRCPVAIPTNIGYEVTIDLSTLPARMPFAEHIVIGYTVDVEVTDDRGRKTMLRQMRGGFTIQ